MKRAKHWTQTHPRDKQAARLYDRHYSRAIFNPGKIGVNQITSTERALVLVTPGYDALWVSQWPSVQARNDGEEIWLNSIFRNESTRLSSELITEAIALTRWYWWPFLPADGFVTYIAPQCVAAKDLPGYCYYVARPRFHRAGTTTKGLIKLRATRAQLEKVQPVEYVPTGQGRLFEVG